MHRETPVTPNLERVIDTPRLTLEPLVADHAAVLLDVLAAPEIYTFIPAEPIVEESGLREKFARLSTRSSPDGTEQWLNWAVRIRGTDEYAGSIQATIKGRLAQVAYLLHPSRWGAGYASEALGHVIEWLRTELDVECFQATIDERNLRSINLVQRLGFKADHRTENADHFKGSTSHEWVYFLDAP